LAEQCQIAVRVTPRAAKPGVCDWRDAGEGKRELEVRVGAAPADGAANAEVVALLAKHLGLAKRDVAIVSGETSRHKRVRVGISLTELNSRLVG
jgi:uncharacterized protein (TIGR00251 family)